MANNFSQETIGALFHYKPGKTNWGNTIELKLNIKVEYKNVTNK